MKQDIDFAAILRRYILHVAKDEGIDFLGGLSYHIPAEYGLTMEDYIAIADLLGTPHDRRPERWDVS